MTGTTMHSNKDILTLAYDRAGNFLWKIYFNGDFDGDDEGTGITADANGNILVAGVTQITDSTYQKVTIKYKTDYFLVPQDSIPAPASLLFYPNAGQIIDTQDSVRRDISFYTINQFPKLYFHQDSISFVMAHVDSDTATADTLERITMNFAEGNMAHGGPYTANTHDTDQVLNYFLGHCPDGITGVTGSEKIMYREVYDKTNVIFSNNNAGMKFQIIMDPGFEPQALLHFTGHQSLQLVNNSDLQVNGVLGSFTYERPLVYQLDNEGNRISLGWLASYYIVDSANVAFQLSGNFDDRMPLVLECARENTPLSLHIEDPEWMTPFGDAEDDVATSCTNDDDGNFYVAGFTNSPYFPIKPGQTAYQGNYDVFVSKFGSAVPPYPNTNADVKNWSTFYGGPNNDMAWSISTIGDGITGQVCIVGEAESGFPTFSNGNTSSYNQSTNKGLKDAFFVKLSSLYGAPTANPTPWATLIGGTNDDIANAVRCDASGNVFIGGTTKSAPCSTAYYCADPTDNNFPLCHTLGTGYFHAVNEGGGDGFLIMFDASENLQLSTFFGGDDEDIIKTIAVDGNGNVIVGGSTASQNSFPLVASSNYDQTTIGGNVDGFVAKFNADLSQAWCTYYGGSGDEVVNSIDIDSYNNIYMGGKTTSDQPAPTAALINGCPTPLYNCLVPPTGKFPMCNPGGDTYFQVDGLCGNGFFGGGTTDGFFSEFGTDGDLKWSTYYGGDGDDEINGISINGEDYVFFTGKTASPPNTFPLRFFQGWGNYMNSSLGPPSTGHAGFVGHFDKSTTLAANELIWSSYCSYWHNGYAPVEEGMNAVSTFARFFYTVGYMSGPWEYNINFFDCCKHGYGQNWIANRDALLVRFSMDNMWMIYVTEIKEGFGSLNLYPNPSSYDLTCKMQFNKSLSFSLQIITPLGDVVYEFTDKLKTEKVVKNIDLNNFSSGIYFIRIATVAGIISSKFIIEK